MPTRCGRAMTASREFLANHAGGIAGGISTGQPVVVRVAFKPTRSILTPRGDDRPRRRGDRDRHQGPPRSLRRHPRHAGGRGDDGAGAGRPQAAASGADRGVVRLRRRAAQCGGSVDYPTVLTFVADPNNAALPVLFRPETQLLASSKPRVRHNGCTSIITIFLMMSWCNKSGGPVERRTIVTVHRPILINVF